VADDVINLIIRDHRQIDKLFDQLLKSSGSDRTQLVNRIGELLIPHNRAEEAKVYPRIAEIIPPETGEVHHGAEEHHEAEKLLRKLRGMQPADAEFESTAHKLIDAVRHHVEEEESDILPTLEDAVEPDALEQLGRDFQQYREQELGKLGKTGSASTSEEPSTHELYEQARKHDVEGRSKMSKEDLARAVQDEKSPRSR